MYDVPPVPNDGIRKFYASDCTPGATVLDSAMGMGGRIDGLLVCSSCRQPIIVSLIDRSGSMLHGSLIINHYHTILEYQITNEGQNLTEDSDKYDYKAVIWGTDNRGYRFAYEWDWIDRGSAPYLLAKVMEEVNRRLTDNDDFRLSHGP